jgi:eukaryotic-like serine/threonine-protein kinase
MAELRRYRAFISYSHKDRAAGGRLFKYLDGYRPPKALVGLETRFGPVPEKLYPIFRDREEFAYSPALAGSLEEKLNASDHLVVMCSPHAAASRWVNEEITIFQRSGRGNRIHAVIVDGEPAMAFPPALTRRPAPRCRRLALADRQLQGGR